MTRAGMSSTNRKLFTRGRGERIVRAAMDLMRQAGWEHASIGRVAGRTGIKEEEIARVFPDERALWSAILSRVHERLMLLLEHVAARGSDPLDALQRVFESHASYIAKNPVVPQLLLSVSQSGDPELRREMREIMEGYEANIAILIGLGKNQGLVKEAIDPRTAALLFLSMIHEFVFRAVVIGDGESILEEAQAMFALYLATIRSGNPRAAAVA